MVPEPESVEVSVPQSSGEKPGTEAQTAVLLQQEAASEQRLAAQLADVKSEIKQEISQLRDEVKEQLAEAAQAEEATQELIEEQPPSIEINSPAPETQQIDVTPPQAPPEAELAEPDLTSLPTRPRKDRFL